MEEIWKDIVGSIEIEIKTIYNKGRSCVSYIRKEELLFWFNFCNISTSKRKSIRYQAKYPFT